MENRWAWLLGFSRFIVQRFSHDRCQAVAANLTLTTLFALVPLVTLMISVFKLLPGLKAARIELTDFLFEHFVPGTGAADANALKAYILDFADNAAKLQLVGAVALVVLALMLMNTIDRAFNAIWGVRARRRVGRKLLFYWSILTLGPLFLGLSIVLSSYLASLPYLRGAAAIARGPLVQSLPFLLTTFGLVSLYFWLPNRRVQPRHAWIAALLAAAGFELAKRGFGIFLAQFSTYKTIYGAAAVLPVTLIWVYLSWLIILSGAEICHGLGVYRLTRFGIRDPFLLAVDMLARIQRGQHKMQRLHSEELLAQTGSENAPEVLTILEQAGFVGRVREQELVLGHSPDKLQLATLYQDLPWRLPKPELAAAELGAEHPLVPMLQRADALLMRELAQPLTDTVAVADAINDDDDDASVAMTNVAAHAVTSARKE